MKRIILSEQDLHEMVRESLNMIMNEAVNQNVLATLKMHCDSFSSDADKFRLAIDKYKGSVFTKYYNSDANFNKFMNEQVWVFLQSLIAAIQRCLKAQNLNEGIKDWVLKTLNDSDIRVPEFIKQGVYDADRYGNRFANSVQNAFGVGNGGVRGGFSNSYARNVRLSELMNQQYPRLRNTLYSYSEYLKSMDNQNVLTTFYNNCEGFYNWFRSVYRTP